MFDFTKREIVLIVGGMLIAAALMAVGTVYVIDTLVIGERDDPLAKAGGLKRDQGR
jgi:hypothetical protein